MRTTNGEENGMFVTIRPGEYYATDKTVEIRTLLGSCVAACLYDPVNRIMGMNHFLLSNRRYAKKIPVCQSEAGRYGIQAMQLLIDSMLKQGARRQNLKAKAFGGATIFPNPEKKDNFICVGSVNARFIREFLIRNAIPLVAEDLGGEAARVIHFLSGDYSVRVRKIERAHAAGIVRYERQCWIQAIEAQEKKGPPLNSNG